MNLPSTLDEFEHFITTLRSDARSFELDIPNVAQRSKFPIEDIARVQALTSWLKAATPDETAAAFQKPVLSQDATSVLANSMLGLSLIILGRSAFRQGDRKSLRLLRNEYFERLHIWPDLARLDASYLICDDSYSKGLPAPLFNSDGFLRTGAQFSRLVPSLVDSVMKSSDLKGKIEEQYPLLTTLLFELVKNTQDHALYDANGSAVEQSLRAFFVRFYPIDSLNVVVDKKSETPLPPHLAFIRSFHLDDDSSMRSLAKKRYRGILEFSVLDSGSGFVGSWLNRTVDSTEDIEIEYQAVLACLRAGHSTARNPNRGLGLSDVLRALRLLNGFIRIRTNRISLYRDFHLLPAQTTNESNGLMDWKRGLSTKPSPFGAVTGAAVSVLIPVEA
ncbi:hypothetical protein PQR71_07100 [Paraburkholderia fungorum]|uniref:hypothetical protein n=1 Tax=Paraburkholderia fungorum TaxID=134537 RepID=UPI0038B74247